MHVRITIAGIKNILLGASKYILLCFFLSSIIFLGCSINKRGSINTKILLVDTIQGYFFYEFNVPLMCYSKLDQIEQSHNLIYFDSLISKIEIRELYQKGVFAYQFQPMVDKFIKKNKADIPQNKTAFWKFYRAISYYEHINDSAYKEQLYYDSKKKLSYKKVFAKFSIVNLGKLKQLVPNTHNYICCYSNKTESLNTYFIIDVLEFKLY